MDTEEVKRFIESSSKESKVYFGADSIAKKTEDGWIDEYALIIVVHKDQRHGGKVFGKRVVEPDYDMMNKRKGKRFVPAMRLMREVQLLSDFFNEFVDSLHIGPDGEILEEGREYEIHMDFSSNAKDASSEVLKQAVSYIRGVCGVEPKFKPDSFAASHCADKLSKNGAWL